MRAIVETAPDIPRLDNNKILSCGDVSLPDVGLSDGGFVALKGR
jgi:hypothetical protein